MRDLTKEEHKVMDLLGHAVIELSKLKPAHPADISEFQVHIHACQNIVLARPGTEEIIGISLNDYPERVEDA